MALCNMCNTDRRTGKGGGVMNSVLAHKKIVNIDDFLTTTRTIYLGMFTSYKGQKCNSGTVFLFFFTDKNIGPVMEV